MQFMNYDVLDMPMRATDAVRLIMRQQGIRHTTLSGRMGIKSNVLTERLSQINITLLKLNEMLRVLDYKLVLIPSDAHLPEGGIEIE